MAFNLVLCKNSQELIFMKLLSNLNLKKKKKLLAEGFKFKIKCIENKDATC